MAELFIVLLIVLCAAAVCCAWALYNIYAEAARSADKLAACALELSVLGDWAAWRMAVEGRAVPRSVDPLAEGRGGPAEGRGGAAGNGASDPLAEGRGGPAEGQGGAAGAMCAVALSCALSATSVSAQPAPAGAGWQQLGGGPGATCLEAPSLPAALAGCTAANPLGGDTCNYSAAMDGASFPMCAGVTDCEWVESPDGWVCNEFTATGAIYWKPLEDPSDPENASKKMTAKDALEASWLVVACWASIFAVKQLARAVKQQE